MCFVPTPALPHFFCLAPIAHITVHEERPHVRLSWCGMVIRTLSAVPRCPIIADVWSLNSIPGLPSNLQFHSNHPTARLLASLYLHLALWGKLQYFQNLSLVLAYFHIPFSLLRASRARRGGERPFSAPFHCIIGLTPVSCQGPPGGAVSPRMRMLGDECEGQAASGERLECTQTVLGLIVNSKMVSPNLSLC